MTVFKRHIFVQNSRNPCRSKGYDSGIGL